MQEEFTNGQKFTSGERQVDRDNDAILWFVSWMFDPETADQKRDYLKMMTPIPLGHYLPDFYARAFDRVWCFAVEHSPDWVIDGIAYPLIYKLNERIDYGE